MATSNGYPGSPRLQQGALIQLNRAIIGVVPSITLFQYNPTTISRGFDFDRPYGEGEMQGLVEKNEERFAPSETYSFKLELDATDDLEKGRPLTETFGVADRIAVLERLIYAPLDVFSTFAESYISLVGGGPLEKAMRQSVPIVLLALGRRRVMPVRVTSLSVSETMHSPAMMPLHAEVDIAFQVIQPQELPKITAFTLPQLDVALAHAAYRLYRFQRDALALAHIATVVSDIQS